MDTSSAIRRLWQDLSEYLRATVAIWWVVVAAVFSFWDQIARFLPQNWIAKVPSWLPEIIAIAALLIGPFLAWRKQRRELLRFKAEWWEAFAESTIETFFSESSRTTPQEQFERLGAIFDERKKEIQGGNYSRAGEIFPIVRAYAPLLARCVPPGSVAYPNRKAEIEEVYEKVATHMEGLGIQRKGGGQPR